MECWAHASPVVGEISFPLIVEPPGVPVNLRVNSGTLKTRDDKRIFYDQRHGNVFILYSNIYQYINICLKVFAQDMKIKFN